CGQSFWLAVQGMFSGYRVPQSRDIAPIVTFQIDRGLKMWHWGNLLVSLVLLKLWFFGVR
ncbi:hypothetical protein NOI65_26335, partial [Escherichia coli]|uniref:hypothetical protein n=1 Tax=Escherichia coli TaxID=562 RepID=UPI002873FD69